MQLRLASQVGVHTWSCKLGSQLRLEWGKSCEVGKSFLSCHCPPLSNDSSCENSNPKYGTWICRMKGFILGDGTWLIHPCWAATPYKVSRTLKVSCAPQHTIQVSGDIYYITQCEILLPWAFPPHQVCVLWICSPTTWWINSVLTTSRRLQSLRGPAGLTGCQHNLQSGGIFLSPPSFSLSLSPSHLLLNKNPFYWLRHMVSFSLSFGQWHLPNNFNNGIPTEALLLLH